MPAIYPSLERQFPEFLPRRGHEDNAEFYIPSAVTGLMAEVEAPVDVRSTVSSWFGVTYREDRLSVAAALRALV